MTLDVGEKMFVFAIKVHRERMIMDLSQYKGEGLNKRKANQFTITIDGVGDWAIAERLVVERHGDNWLCPQLRPVFAYIHHHPEAFQSTFHCVVIRDARSSAVVAVELGYCVGTIYTSLTGSYSRSGCGTVQMAALGLVLKARGYLTWDFGMAMDYKAAMGGGNLGRKQWLARVAKERDGVPSVGPLGALAAEGPMPCVRFLPHDESIVDCPPVAVPCLDEDAKDLQAKKKSRKAEKLAKSLEWLAKNKVARDPQ
jgi:hypothetical protein